MEPRILDTAARELANLDRKVARRITARINWLADNWHDLKPEALSGDLVGLFKLRVLVIHAIGHRRDVYRRK
jgi:mRNA interferase RelE/StbE